MNLVNTLEELIIQGEELRPQGGTKFDGYNGELQPEYVAWRLQAISAIQEIGQAAKPILKEIEQDSDGPFFYEASASRILGALKAAVAIALRQGAENAEPRAPAPSQNEENMSPRVFVVHGRDEVLLQQSARFLEKLELEPVMLFEQAGRSQTIIEKLEAYSDVKYAVVLLTPDDVGKLAGQQGQLQPRARQNVILELGYFIGKLGRSRVAVLYDESVELPSDYRGVEYIKVDAEGAWKMKLARELRHTGLDVDMNKAI